MSGDNMTPSTPAIATSRDRRASFSPGQPFTSIFGRSPTKATGTSAFPGPIASAAANTQTGRRMSISTLGLSGSPTQTSPFAAGASRRESVSSAGTGSASSTLEESAVEDGDSPVTAPTSPLARRMSFGAKALRDVRNGLGGANNGNNEGFNWSDSLRSRAQRASTISALPPNSAASAAAGASSIAEGGASSGNAAAAAAPAPRAPKAHQVPDHFQERILKGDFYMD